jgi:cell division protein FtsQ
MPASAARPNRKLPQRRPLGARVSSALHAAGRAAAVGLRRAAPTVAVLALLAGLAGAVALGVRWLRTSPRFALHDLRVTGNARVPTDEILRRAGVAPGTNLFAIRVHDVEAGVRHSPWIAEVEARRSLPDGLTIRVVEREPAAVVVAGAGMYLADASGRPFKRAGSAEAAGLPVISGITRRLFVERPELAAGLVRRGLEIAAGWRGHDRPALGEIHFDAGGVTLYTLEGAVAIALGRDPSDATMRRFDAAWGALPPEERAQIRTIHLDSRTRPDRVTVSLAETR